MTAKTKTPKAPKVEIVDAEILKEISTLYSNLVNHDGEIQFVLDVASLMKSGKASVRSVQEAIGACVGTAPTIRKSHAQFFTIFAEIVGEIADAQNQPVAEILKMAERVSRNHGAEKSSEIIKASKSFAELGEKSPTQTKARKNAKADKLQKVSEMTIEQVIGGSLQAIRKVGGKNLKDLKTSDLDNLRALLMVLVQIDKNSEPKPKVNA